MSMFWDRHGEITAWWSIGVTLLFWVVIIALAVWLFTRMGAGRSAPGESAEEHLRRRFAAGEIDEEEYTKRLEILRRK